MGLGRPDPSFWFDDIAIFNRELSREQVKSIVGLKKNAIYGNTFSLNEGDAKKMGAGDFIDNSTPGFGRIFKNAVGSAVKTISCSRRMLSAEWQRRKS